MSCGKTAYAPRPVECPYDPPEPKCREKKCVHFMYKLWDIVEVEKPLVSIIMPYYNNKPTIRKAVKSIIEQTYKNWELVLVNDGGDDEPDKVVKQLDKEGYAVVYHEQDNHGQAQARNKAFTLSSGQFIAYLDADDEWMPTHLEECLIKILDNYHIVYGNFKYKYYNSIDDYTAEPYNYDGGIMGNEVDFLDSGNFIAIHTVMHDRRLFVLAGGFEEGVVCGEDGVLWRRMAEINARFGFRSKPTSYYCRYDKVLPEYHQSKILKMPDKMKGVHLVGKGTNGQELDIQETYNKRIEMLKPFAEPRSNKINYIDKAK